MAADPEVPWDLVAKVRRSKRKSEIIKELADDPASASELSEDFNIKTASVSNLIRELKNMDPPLVICLTPEQPHHRLYGLTETGEKVYQHL